MANYLKLRDIKKHLNIDSYYTDDDIYLEALMNVAEKVVEKHIDLGLSIVADYNGGELPPPLIHAMLLFIGNMYANRESVAFASASEIPLSYQYILDLYKCYNPSNYSFAMTIIDNLTSNSTTDALSANQGRILKELIDSINVEVDLTNYYTKQQTDALMTTKADVTHTHVIGQVADLQAELDAKANVSDLPDVSQLMTETTADNKYQPKGDYLTSVPDEYVTDTELSAKNYATQAWVNEQGYLTQHQDITGLATKEELNRKQDTLVSGNNIKTINSQSLLGDGNIEITVEGGGITDAPNDGKLYGRKSEQWTEVVIQDTSNLATKAELGAKLDTATYNEEKATFAKKTEIPDTSTLATKTELSEGLAGKADKSSLGNYLIKTEAQSTYATKSELEQKLDTSTYNSEKATFALKSELPDTSNLVTKATADETYQPKGSYITSIPEEYVTDTELNAKNYATTEQLNLKQDTLVSGNNIKTVNGNSLLGEGNITIEGGSSITIDTELSETSVNPVQNKVINTALNNKVDLTVYNAKITEMEAMIGQISTKLDNINGEVVV